MPRSRPDRDRGSGAAAPAGADLQLNVREHDGGASFALRVQPRAARNAIGGVHAGALKVSLNAPPVDGAANDALLRLLADRLGVPRRALRLLRGERSRDKVVHVLGLDAAALRALLHAAG